MKQYTKINDPRAIKQSIYIYKDRIIYSNPSLWSKRGLEDESRIGKNNV